MLLGKKTWSVAAMLILGGCAQIVQPEEGTEIPEEPTEKPPTQENPEGAVTVFLHADAGSVTDEVVTIGVPLGKGTFSKPEMVRVLDTNGNEVPSKTKVLAVWPQDQSIRSLLVGFPVTLDEGTGTQWTIEFGVAPEETLSSLVANPNSAVTALLPPNWYASSRTFGMQAKAPLGGNFGVWGEALETNLENMSPGWRDYGVACETGDRDRTFYDTPHALYQRFIANGDADSYRRAREEVIWYRENNLKWSHENEVAVYKCTEDYNPTVALTPKAMRYSVARGLADDYLITGDPASLTALQGIGEAFVRNAAAMHTNGAQHLRSTERNLAFAIYALTAYYSIDQSVRVKSALDLAVDLAISWQNETTSGAFEHDLTIDPEECGLGTGGSPFMTSLLVDALMDAWLVTNDSRISDAVIDAASWLRYSAIRPDGEAFQYLVGCEDTDYATDDWVPRDLNLAISHVFTAAGFFSGESDWVDFAQTMVGHGLSGSHFGTPKHWTLSGQTYWRLTGYLDAMVF